jgi:putative addiction module CopG family antidote
VSLTRLLPPSEAATPTDQPSPLPTPRLWSLAISRAICECQFLTFLDKVCYLAPRCWRLMNVSLTSELEELVNEKVRSGLYQTASEVVREALRLLKQRDDEVRRADQRAGVVPPPTGQRRDTRTSRGRTRQGGKR